MYNTIRLETREDGIATLTLARAEKHNCLSAEMIAELSQAAERISQSQDIRAVILAAEGKSFCAGGDLKWMQAQMEADSQTRKREAMKLAMMLSGLNSLPQPLIAKVQGGAYGGGVGLMSVSDVAIGVEGASFGLTETRLGVIPATIAPYVVARVGEGCARRMFTSSRRFSAQKAKEFGLLAETCEAGDLDKMVQREAEQYLSCAPGAVADAKAMARALGPDISQETIELTVDRLVRRWEQPEARKGIEAFFDKRPPPWAPGGSP